MPGVPACVSAGLNYLAASRRRRQKQKRRQRQGQQGRRRRRQNKHGGTKRKRIEVDVQLTHATGMRIAPKSHRMDRAALRRDNRKSGRAVDTSADYSAKATQQSLLVRSLLVQWPASTINSQVRANKINPQQINICVIVNKYDCPSASVRLPRRASLRWTILRGDCPAGLLIGCF